MTTFDEAVARTTFVASIDPTKRSTQSWDVDAWSASWRDAAGALEPGTLGPAGGAWWFRALTDPGRLTGNIGNLNTDALTSVSARARLTAFIDDANQILVHWPTSALALVAFPLREAIGTNEAMTVLVEVIPSTELAAFIAWIGPVDPGVAQRWLPMLSAPEAIATLGRASAQFEPALQRLGDATAVAERLAEDAPPAVWAAWALEHDARISIEQLRRVQETCDDSTFAACARRVLAKRDRRVWQLLIDRPVADLVPDVLKRIDDPVAPWAIRYFRAGNAAVIDALIRLADGKSKRAKSAIRVLKLLDRTDVLGRLDEHQATAQNELREALSPTFDHLPELPRSHWRPWMTAVSQREPVIHDWLNTSELPQLSTKSGYKLPRAVHSGLLALLTEVEFDLSGSGVGRYDSALDELHGWLDPASANAFWNSLFAMWWTNHQPDVRWVAYAAAFLCDGPAIRDLGAKLRRHRTWFGHLSPRVVAALGHNPTDWSIAALDDIARRTRNSSHRELAEKFLTIRAEAAGLTVDRLIESRFPDEDDALLIELAAGRLEDAMNAGRIWTDFTWSQTLSRKPFAFSAHSVLWFLEHAWGAPIAVRLEGDELLDVHDEPAPNVEDPIFRVAHPAELSAEELRMWSARFADYELVQPFEQLERRYFRYDSLSRDGFQSPVGAAIEGREFLRRAVARGWTTVSAGAHGNIVAIERTFPRLESTIRLNIGDPLARDGRGTSTATSITFHAGDGTSLDADQVHPIAFSEAHIDIIEFQK